MRVRLLAALLLGLVLPAVAQDEPPFEILGQDPVVAPAESRHGAIVTFDVPVYGRGSETAVISCSQRSGTLFRMGPTRVSCTGVTAHGDRAQGGVYVFVYDAKPPVLTIPRRLVVETDDANGTAVRWDASAHDDIDDEVPIVCSPASGSRFPIGVTQVDCYAEDAHFNRGTGSFEVVVRRGDQETEPLALHLPNDLFVEASNNAGARVTFEATTSGGTAPVEITCTPNSGSNFSLGVTAVQCSARDSFGETAAGTFTVTVADTTPPIISYLSADPPEIHPPNRRMIDVTIGVQSHDIVDPMPLCQVVNVTGNQPIDGDWQITGPFTLQVRAARTGDDRIYTLHVTCTDDFGNAAARTTRVIVARGSNAGDTTTPPPTTTKKPVGKR